MGDEFKNIRQVSLSILVASLLMLIGGMIYFLIAARLPVPKTALPVSSDALQPIPMQIAGWNGENVPIDESIIERTGSDAHINRRYLRESDRVSLMLYVSCGSRIGSMIGHRPEGCYPAAGWKLVNQRFREVSITDDTKLPCSILEFSRDRLGIKRIVVLNYFIADGQYCGDYSAVRSRVGYRLAEVYYVTQVQILAFETSDVSLKMLEKTILDFAMDSSPLISEVFEHIQHDMNSSESIKTLGAM